MSAAGPRHWTPATSNRIVGEVVKEIATGREGVAVQRLPGRNRVRVSFNDGTLLVMYWRSLKIAQN